MEYFKDRSNSNFFRVVVEKGAVARKRADSNLSPFFRHGIVTVLPWETHAGEKAGESVLPRNEI